MISRRAGDQLKAVLEPTDIGRRKLSAYNVRWLMAHRELTLKPAAPGLIASLLLSAFSMTAILLVSFFRRKRG